MGYVKTDEELDELQAVMAKPQARDGRLLFIQFETDDDFVSSVLPPGLVPNGVPASLTVGEWRGSNAGPYRASFLMVGAQPESAEDPKGTYCLSFFISDDSAILFGRPMMGEPKKLGDIEFSVSNDKVSASVTRFGTKIVSASATIGAEIPGSEIEAPAYWYKHQPAVNGDGLQYDPVLILQKNTQKPTKVMLASAEMSLAGTVHDPLGDIPVTGVKAAVYMEGDIFAECSVVTTVDREKFLPYAFAGYDDWTALIKEGS